MGRQRNLNISCATWPVKTHKEAWTTRDGKGTKDMGSLDCLGPPCKILLIGFTINTILFHSNKKKDEK